MASGAAPAPARKRRPVSPLTFLGVVLLAAGLVCLGWVGWQYFGTNIVSRQEAGKEIAALKESWGGPSAAPTATDEPVDGDGTPLAGSAQWLIRIPAFGSDYVWPIVAGVGVNDLSRGVGWYPTTSQPGEVGNFALAGHRITHGEPFRRMLELTVGDTIIIETRDAVLTYELTSAPGQLTVQDTETWVLDPVPGHEDVTPSEALITLTTCEDLFHSPDRSVAFGKLATTETK
ncbi:sortase [Tessaracoccus antarcticus]|uniref:Sortase n=2 Tax=Tessaracoccus antarcticus TaxID=2479848 RepID=A0A3M0GCH3_9ACTN|nr:sortase [Tessaracoccus antarcticus]